MLRETLAVLLERDCHLEFLSPGTPAAVAALSPDLAVLATPRPIQLLEDLTRRCPTLPIVAVEVASTTSTGESPPEWPDGIMSVPLEPDAIRTAVMEKLTREPDAALRAAVRMIAATLQADLTDSLAALRSCAQHLAKAGTDADAALGTVVRQHSDVASEALEEMLRFHTRPRLVEQSPEFAAAVCRELAGQDAVAEQHLLCAWKIDAAVPHAVGPVTLAPIVAGFLRAHLRRRVESSVVSVRATEGGVTLSYPLKTPADTTPNLLPLRLAEIALQARRWTISTSSSGHAESISLAPMISCRKWHVTRLPELDK